jgi:hypothetical protein
MGTTVFAVVSGEEGAVLRSVEGKGKGLEDLFQAEQATTVPSLAIAASVVRHDSM